MNPINPNFAEFVKDFFKSPSGKIIIIPVLILLLGNILYFVLIADDTEEIAQTTKLKTFETKLPDAKVDAKTLESKAKIYNETDNSKVEPNFPNRDSSLTHSFTDLVTPKKVIPNQNTIPNTDPYAQKPLEMSNSSTSQAKSPEEMYSRKQAAREDILNEYEFKNKVVQLQTENIRLNAERKNVRKSNQINANYSSTSSSNNESDRQKVAKWLKAQNGGENYLNVKSDTFHQNTIYTKKVGFYGLRGAMKPIADLRFETVPAEIHDNQTVQNGSMVKIRLLKDMTVKGITIPKDQFLSGVCSLNNSRLLIQISSIGSRRSAISYQLSE